MRSLAKDFDVSICARSLVGPIDGILFSFNLSTTPLDKGFSGPMIARLHSF